MDKYIDMLIAQTLHGNARNLIAAGWHYCYVDSSANPIIVLMKPAYDTCNAMLTDIAERFLPALKMASDDEMSK